MLLSGSLQAQIDETAIPVGTFTVNGKTFIARTDIHLFDDGTRSNPNRMEIVRQGGEFHNSRLGLGVSVPVTTPCYNSVQSYNIEYQKADFVRYYDILRSVFSLARCNAIMDYDNNGLLSLHVQADPNGTVLDIEFVITENTLITPQEIEALYTAMLTQMTFSVTPVGCPSNYRFFVEECADDLREIYTDPYYFGNGPEWKDK